MANRPDITKEFKLHDTEKLSQIHHKPKKPRKSPQRHDDHPPEEQQTSGKMTFKDYAYYLLKREGKPLRVELIVHTGLREGTSLPLVKLTLEGLIATRSKTPEIALAATLCNAIKSNKGSPFIKVAPMTFGLVEWNEEEH